MKISHFGYLKRLDYTNFSGKLGDLGICVKFRASEKSPRGDLGIWVVDLKNGGFLKNPPSLPPPRVRDRGESLTGDTGVF